VRTFIDYWGEKGDIHIWGEIDEWGCGCGKGEKWMKEWGEATGGGGGGYEK
jgi:hypothetical protein